MTRRLDEAFASFTKSFCIWIFGRFSTTGQFSHAGGKRWLVPGKKRMNMYVIMYDFYIYKWNDSYLWRKLGGVFFPSISFETMGVFFLGTVLKCPHKFPKKFILDPEIDDGFCCSWWIHVRGFRNREEWPSSNKNEQTITEIVCFVSFNTARNMTNFYACSPKQKNTAAFFDGFKNSIIFTPKFGIDDPILTKGVKFHLDTSNWSVIWTEWEEVLVFFQNLSNASFTVLSEISFD